MRIRQVAKGLPLLLEHGADPSLRNLDGQTCKISVPSSGERFATYLYVYVCTSG